MKMRFVVGLIIGLMMFGPATADAINETITGLFDSNNSPASVNPEIHCNINHDNDFPWRVYYKGSVSNMHHH